MGGKGGPKATVGVPGTGISHTTKLGKRSKARSAEGDQPTGVGSWSMGKLLLWGIAGLFVFLVVRGLITGT